MILRKKAYTFPIAIYNMFTRLATSLINKFSLPFCKLNFFFLKS